MHKAIVIRGYQSLLTKIMSQPVLLTFKFENFAHLPNKVDQPIKARVQSDCNGNRWSLELYPAGDRRAKESGRIALFLCSKNAVPNLDVKIEFLIKDKTGVSVDHSEFRCKFIKDNSGFGNSSFAKRSDILDETKGILKNEALLIDVIIQVKDGKDVLHQPIKDISLNQLQLLRSGGKSDIIFQVGSKRIPAHSPILYANAPLLSEICDQENSSTVTIQNVAPEVFQFLLEHIYSANVPSVDDVFKWGKELIDASNRFELIELKMAVENLLVRECILNKENVCEYILFSDAQSCPLLKEYAISYFLLNAQEILQSDHSKQLRESSELLSEIIVFQGRGLGEMRVTTLRKELGKRNLDVDGSKRALVSRYEEAKRQKKD